MPESLSSHLDLSLLDEFARTILDHESRDILTRIQTAHTREEYEAVVRDFQDFRKKYFQYSIDISRLLQAHLDLRSCDFLFTENPQLRGLCRLRYRVRHRNILKPPAPRPTHQTDFIS